MEKDLYLTILYDYYGQLLTEKQQTYFTYYYFDNLSLSEISENLKVSRNAVHKELKFLQEKLEFFESKLHLYEKNEKLSKILENVNEELRKEIEEILYK